MEHTYDSLFIGGDWIAPSSAATITVASATTEEPIGRVPEAVSADVDAAVAAARSAFDDPTGWATWDPGRRAEAMERLADMLGKRGEQFAQLVSRENGMPIVTSRRSEAVIGAAVLRYYAALPGKPASRSPARRWPATAPPSYAVPRSGWSPRSCRGTSRRP